jgi:DUF438 domain-containing protein
MKVKAFLKHTILTPLIDRTKSLDFWKAIQTNETATYYKFQTQKGKKSSSESALRADVCLNAQPNNKYVCIMNT